MNPTFDPKEAARFLRTLRVTTQTALALNDVERARGRARPVSSFTALAAKGTGEWRFPAAGLLSADGLVLANLLHQGDEETKVLSLQAQGAAGLATYALRGARVRLGEALQIEGVFDRDGALHIVLDKALSEAELSLLEIELLDPAP
ncbi:MAG: hypothetical protein ABSC22_02545 [Roseiarcus sp.]|jgi:hypothetical protein